MHGTRIMLLAGTGILAAMLPQARADEFDQKTNVTFSGPVEIPGVVLPAGTYEFKLMDSESDRNIVQVFNKDQTHLYGTFVTVPDYRLKPAGKDFVTFEERAAGSPEAVKAWFYPGDNYGHEFVYPKTKAVTLAKANNTPVPSMPDEMAANTTKPAPTVKAPPVVAMKQTPLKAQKPTEEEVEVLEVFAVPPPSENHQLAAMVTGQTAASTPTAGRQLVSMPETGSVVPLIGMLGMLSLCAAGAMRLALKNGR